MFSWYTFSIVLFFFFFNDTATTEIYTLSLHDALPISAIADVLHQMSLGEARERRRRIRSAPTDELRLLEADRKSTRLNSSHANISYAVFCLKKKKKNRTHKTISVNFYDNISEY